MGSRALTGNIYIIYIAPSRAHEAYGFKLIGRIEFTVDGRLPERILHKGTSGYGYIETPKLRA